MKTRACILSSVFLITAGCGTGRSRVDAPSQSSDVAAEAFAVVKAQVFDTSCMPCHGGARPRAGVNLSTLAGATASAAAIQKAVFVEQKMPPRTVLTAEQKAALTAWLGSVAR